MTNLLPYLLQVQEELHTLIHTLEQELNAAPSGHIRISRQNEFTSIRYVPESLSGDKKRSPIYMRKDQRGFAASVAQKDYNRDLLQVARKQLAYIEDLMAHYSPTIFVEQYTKLHPLRQQLIKPHIIPDDVYAKQWERVEYEHKGFKDGMPEIYTQRGERVRSKSEMIIADHLYHRGIPYRYEYPLELSVIGVVHPDFLLLNTRTHQEFYLEHLGMMDDPKYAKNNISKINQYIRDGYIPGKNLILSFETSATPLNIMVLDELIDAYLV